MSSFYERSTGHALPNKPSFAGRTVIVTLVSFGILGLSYTFWEPFVHPEKFREKLEIGKEFRSNVEKNVNKSASMWKKMDSKIKNNTNYEVEFEKRMEEYETKQKPNSWR